MIVRACLLTILVGLCSLPTLRSQDIPPGYTLVRATETPQNEGTPNMNIHGQIVFHMRSGSDNSTLEIYLYDGRTRELTRITDDELQDVGPDINDDGVITWARGFGPVTPDARWLEIVYRTPDGTITRLSDNEVVDSGPAINRHGQITWQQNNGRGCAESGRHVMLFDGETVRQITDNDWDNQAVDLNDGGDIIWTEFNFCFQGFNWRSKIKLYRDGRILTLMDDDDLQAQATNINNVGTCAWSSSNRNTREQAVYLWDDGVRTVLTDWGQRPIQNDLGDVALQRGHEDIQRWQTWVYFKGEFVQVSDPEWNALTPAINNARELAWKFGGFPWGDIAYMRRLEAGDLNCDGSIDAADIEGFLLAMIDPENFPPDCDPALADINEDGSVDLLDIEPFIELLIR